MQTPALSSMSPAESLAITASVAAIIAALLCALFLRAMLASRFARRLLDQANERSMHVGAIPRIGGQGILLAVLTTLGTASLLPGVSWPFPFSSLVVIATVVFSISLLDDLHSLSARLRLGTHLGCALALCLVWGVPPLWLAVSVITLGWGANLYNFMDGADGLAGAMTAIGFGALALASIWTDQAALALICAAISGAAIGFLTLNWHPAKLFMGDAGSVTLGFCATAIGVHGAMNGHWSIAFPLTVFMPFIFDASLTLLRRAAKRKSLAQAHREHLYQRAALAGFGHQRVSLAAALLMLVSAFSSLIGLTISSIAQFAIAFGVIAFHILLWHLVERRLLIHRSH
jgi:UDP-N-acetylmuramyl pentapeptide phosphotransferase/UDP-N-acetylglucosamine-1-phosphate transferase